ncbi:MAG: acryloyl-CoA reductase [SAR324 cluster bacterium]|nr:acryloyl-CoA reductase [SAR324 cluster bacterium]
MEKTMQAYVLEGSAEAPQGSVTTFETANLPEGEVTVKVEYSSVNYKDAMINVGAGKMVRKFPHIPGIDFSGEVISDATGRLQPGDKVTLSGHEVGLGHFGGYAQFARVPAAWVVKLPAGLNTLEASALGTAGFTAMLGLMALERNGLTPGAGPVLITGATGGVGSTAVDIFARAGYTVAASSGKADMAEFLRKLGAERVLAREEVQEDSGRVLLKEEWAGGLDQVGGPTLEYLLRATRTGGSVAATGMVHSHTLSTTVYPFILRGVSLLGVDSQHCPMEVREAAWAKLGGKLKPKFLSEIAREIPLADLPGALKEILAGGARGRYVVKMP